jgi:predicted ribosomally synthesized six-cysteine peptide SCIFF
MKHIKVIVKNNMSNSSKTTRCGECQTSCQSACKVSCTVANQVCENESKK